MRAPRTGSIATGCRFPTTPGRGWSIAARSPACSRRTASMRSSARRRRRRRTSSPRPRRGACRCRGSPTTAIPGRSDRRGAAPGRSPASRPASSGTRCRRPPTSSRCRRRSRTTCAASSGGRSRWCRTASIPPTAAPPSVDPLPIAADRFTLVHTGTLTNGSRDPGLLFAALDALVARGDVPVGALEVWFVGRHLEVARRTAARWPALAPAIRYAGAVPRATALDAQRRATVLVALGSPDAAYDGDVPTKVFEYLDARRPILAIASHQSALAALLADTRGGRIGGHRRRGRRRAGRLARPLAARRPRHRVQRSARHRALRAPATDGRVRAGARSRRRRPPR